MGIFSIMSAIFLSLIFIGSGFMCKSLANEKSNDGMGYRTKLSKKNADTWREANTYGGIVFIKCGIVYFVLSLILTIIFYNNPEIALPGTSLGMIPVILVGVFISEKHMRSVFDSEGNRK